MNLLREGYLNLNEKKTLKQNLVSHSRDRSRGRERRDPSPHTPVSQPVSQSPPPQSPTPSPVSEHTSPTHTHHQPPPR